ncbi:hypothetical protein AWQ21_15465 (plasmid) [Picosynechococcus sp. PCC 7003]|uniref:hypothetical protein n=1 Tax=Picosynechococcus sp. PCC 7003 TaxID=374981 RepID=UPI000810EC7D|nr:hypothetical protein [Picosynechococcus sp. PCC 7003]ANV85924.1 hypothetical protein AWQ21_15465 [Picosynechococcus sp. PCC 7003]
MSLDYYGLPLEQQQYLAQRFGAYGLDPELAYDTLLPDTVKNQGPEAIEEFMRHKDISHIYPQSQYPHLSGDLNNVFLEDPYVNAARGDQVVTQDEIWAAQQDNLSDAWDGDFNDNGLLDSWEFLF